MAREIEEVWKPTRKIGYEVSNLGRVRSLDRIIVTKTGKKCLAGRILKCGKAGSRRSYWMVMLGKDTPANVHDLVATAFLGPKPSPKHEVGHEDNDGLNNIWTNLKWVTRKQNMEHCVDSGRARGGSLKGEANKNSKITRQIALEIREHRNVLKWSLRGVANKFFVSVPLVSKIARGVLWP